MNLGNDTPLLSRGGRCYKFKEEVSTKVYYTRRPQRKRVKVAGQVDNQVWHGLSGQET